ncbi:hypothetical protein RCG19_19170 [Neobacillus sp. OS1-2]|uniref:hypothetical protein n=1 Tax=Neobacillus sp. OS1-2 TaxID=3070680 RepID=UPI0027DEDA41|nr:hypothetical protein [Neobacillus sp. OS1-2]WML39281.1 hypothetical protein RCG19_19170 [Neobacillus sp. OS1-2]
MMTHHPYDHHFNGNEWFVIGMIIGGLGLIYFLPKMYPLLTTLFFLLMGPYLGLVFDHTLAVLPLDLYDVGDSPGYSLFDLLSYTMYAPFGYIFIYFYEKLYIKGQATVIYIIIWSLMAILLEWMCVKVGIFRYKNGYKLFYSIPVYFFVESLLLLLYLKFFKIKPRNHN